MPKECTNLSSWVKFASSGTQHQCRSGVIVMKICVKYTQATKNANGIIKRKRIFWYMPNSPMYGSRSSNSKDSFLSSTTFFSLMFWLVSHASLANASLVYPSFPDSTIGPWGCVSGSFSCGGIVHRLSRHFKRDFVTREYLHGLADPARGNPNRRWLDQTKVGDQSL